MSIALSMVLAVALLTAFGPRSPGSFSAWKAGAAPACQSDGANGCLGTLPCPKGPCPSVDATPVNGVKDGQYVFIKSLNFASGDSMRVAICSTSAVVSPDPSDPSCLSGQWEANTWNPNHVPIAVNPSQQNETQVSLPVFFDQPGSGNSPLPAHDVLFQNPKGVGMFCDDTADPCALEITEEPGTGTNVGNGPPVSTANTVVIPLTFAAQATGCPSKDATIQTASSFSLEHFIPPAVDATCKSAGGAVALNTATDNVSAASDFASGGASIAFIDDPGDPDVQSRLAGKHYTYIPVAVSATVVGYLAEQSLNGQIDYPASSYNLTPNMVAGLITSEYQTADGSPTQVGNNVVPGFSDNLIPPLNCADLFGCPSIPSQQIYNELGFNTFSLLNPTPANVQGPAAFGSYMSNVSNGSSYQVTDWICRAPNTPFPIKVNERSNPQGKYRYQQVTVTDRNVAGTTLISAPVGTSIWPPYTTPKLPNGPSWVFPTCHGYGTFPALASGDTNYGESQNPSFQAKLIRSFAYSGQVVPQLTSVPYAGFGVMDSSDADFNGLNSASLQNADGSFVYPSAQNIESAASALVPCTAGVPTCPVGSFSIDYGKSPSPTSYPMPDITYALVSTSPQTVGAVTATKDLLTSLVSYSHGTNLPDGYAPLPDSLYQAAISDISNLGAIPGSSKKPPSTVATAGGSPSVSGSGASANTSGTTGSNSSQTLPITSARAGKVHPGGSAHHGAGTSGGIGSGLTASAITLLGLDEAARYLLPLLVVLTGACLITGSLLYFVIPAYRRRQSPSGGAE